MPKNYQELIREIADLASAALPKGVETGMRLGVDGVNFSVQDNHVNDPETIVYLCEVCSLPGEGLRNDMLQALLEHNLQLLGLHAPSFAIDSERQLILLGGCTPVSLVTGESMLQAFAQFAAVAKEWQRRLQSQKVPAAASTLYPINQGSSQQYIESRSSSNG